MWRAQSVPIAGAHIEQTERILGNVELRHAIPTGRNLGVFHLQSLKQCSE